MTRTAIPISEFDTEMATTRRLIERVPSDKAKWKPHEKSFALAHLAQLVCSIPEWIVKTLREPSLDLSAGAGYAFQSTEALLAKLDDNVRRAREALVEVTGNRLDEVWQLKMGERVLMAMPKGEVTRMHISHLVHHRGQLTVYLRLLDVPIPSIYGPTADENWG